MKIENYLFQSMICTMLKESAIQWMGKWFLPPSKKLATRSMQHFLSPLLSPVWKRLRVVHKRSKYSSQDIRTYIVFKLARFQCLNFPALPFFQTHSWIYLAFVFQFTSLHYDYQNMCVYVLFLKLFFFFSAFLFCVEVITLVQEPN